MRPIHLFEVASRQAEWLSVRQATIAGNIANANTPNFKARDVEPFSEALTITRLTMTGTRPGHMQSSGAEFRSAEIQESMSWETTHSGNSVSLEQEMMKAGEITRDFTLANSIVKSFHRMLLAAAKG